MSKKILITGAAGFVGRHLVRLLKDQDYEIYAMVRENTDLSFFNKEKIQTVKADLRNPQTITPAVKGMDVIIHLATTMKGPWEEYEEGTVHGTRRLAEVALEEKVERFIYVSSIAVYDALNAKGAEVTEQTAVLKDNLSNYERSKIEAEDHLLRITAKGLSSVILRSGVIYGPGGPLFPPRLGYGSEGRYVVIGNGENKVPFVYVENFVEAISTAIDAQVKSGSTFNIIDDLNMTQNRYLSAIKEEVVPGLGVTRISYDLFLNFSKMVGWLLGKLKRPSPIRESYIYLCSHQVNYLNDKAKKELGYTSKVNLDEALSRTTSYFAQSRSNHRVIDHQRLKGNVSLSKDYQVGIIGCGVIAKTHLDILKKIKQVTVVAVCDQNLDAAKALADEYGIKKAFKSVDDMFTEEKLDAVHVLTPPQSRLEICRLAAQHKCHIFLEKPMAMNAEEGRLIAKAVKEADVKLCMGHNHLFDPQMIEARRLLAKGAVGKICYVESWYGFNLGANLSSRYMVPGAENHWSMHLPGKLYQNLFSHPYSVLSDVIGDPTVVKAIATSAGVVKSMRSDELKVFVKQGSASGTITVSLGVNPRYQFMNIYGTDMCLYIDFLNKTVIKHSTPKGIPKPISRALMSIIAGFIYIGSTLRNVFKVLTKSFTYFDGTETLIKLYYQRLDENGEMPVSVEDGVKSMEVMDEVWKQVEI